MRAAQAARLEAFPVAAGGEAAAPAAGASSGASTSDLWPSGAHSYALRVGSVSLTTQQGGWGGKPAGLCSRPVAFLWIVSSSVRSNPVQMQSAPRAPATQSQARQAHVCAPWSLSAMAWWSTTWARFLVRRSKPWRSCESVAVAVGGNMPAGRK